MWLRNTCKKYYISVLTGVYLAAVLWITLFSRIGSGYRGFLLPFTSYIEVFKGNWHSLEEIIENIILFMPLGMVLGAVKRWGWKGIIVIGLCSSLSIELLQAIFALGTFEFDDLIHNTIGTVVGCWIIRKIGFRGEIRKLQLRVLFIALFMSVISPIIIQEVHHQHMVKLAALHNRKDGAENLLVLNGQNGYAWDTDVYVKYLDDGSINIKGTSDKTSWYPIGKLKLKPGEYVFSGLSDVDENTVGLELASGNSRIAPDIGPNDEVRIEFRKISDLIIYVIVYPGCDCDVIATPVIYKEG
ncbi:hypothetical protein B5F13_01135 [Drancourtella sp. An177]|nr:hypothetical protein B5F13_01135 [Drancourtella sp. An177]